MQESYRQPNTLHGEIFFDSGYSAPFYRLKLWEENDNLPIFKGTVLVSFFLVAVGPVQWAHDRVGRSGNPDFRGPPGFAGSQYFDFPLFQVGENCILFLLLGGMGLYFADLYQTVLIFSTAILWSPIFGVRLGSTEAKVTL